jgi:uncharacterized membrane protein YvbJ
MPLLSSGSVEPSLTIEGECYLVKCSKCGKEDQLDGVYCSNCGIPVQGDQRESLQADHQSRVRLIVGVLAGITLLGVGMVLGLFGDAMDMSGTTGVGYVILVVGIIVILASIVLFGWLRK